MSRKCFLEHFGKTRRQSPVQVVFINPRNFNEASVPAGESRSRLLDWPARRHLDRLVEAVKKANTVEVTHRPVSSLLKDELDALRRER